MVSTHNSSILFQPLEVNQCSQTPLSMSDSDIGSLHQYPNPIDEQTIAEPMSLLKGSKVLKHNGDHLPFTSGVEYFTCGGYVIIM